MSVVKCASNEACERAEPGLLMEAPEGRIAILTAGQNLRSLRERLGLTMREVETASARIAERHGNDEFAVSPSRLSDIETKGLVPSIFRLYSLAVIYRSDVREVLSWYGVDLSLSATDLDLNLPPDRTLPKPCKA